MAENLLKTAFRGGEKGFVSGHYAIWERGLGEHAPNGYALKVGTRVAEQLLSSKRSTHGNAIYGQFLSHLKNIQAKEAGKEGRYLMRKFYQLEQVFNDQQYLSAINSALANEDYGAVYTLITDKHKDIKEMRRELKSNKFQSLQKMNSFWHSQFFTYFYKRLSELMRVKDGKLIAKLSSSNLTIEQIVDEWMEEMLTGSNGAVESSLGFIENQFKDSLVTFLSQNGLSVTRGTNILGLNLDSLMDTKDVKRVMARKGKKNVSRTAKGRLSDIAEALINRVGNGLSTELMGIAEQGRTGAKAISGGNLTKEIAEGLRTDGYSVYQKNDIVSIDITGGEYDLDSIVNDLYKELAENGGDIIKAIEKQLLITEEILNDIFIIETNVKGYVSKQPLNIEGEGSWRNRLDNLYKMQDAFPAKTMDRLIFLMVNAFDQCIASNRLDQLKDYIAATVAAWMWDDYDQLFNINEQSTIQRVRMFKSGSYYFSASQVLQIGIEALENGFAKHKNGFVEVNIKKPSFNAEQFYKNLVESNPVEDAIKKEDENAVQNILKIRWDTMRDRILDEGTISISFNQQALEGLLGKMKEYIFDF